MVCSVEKFSWHSAMQLALPKEHGSWSLALEPVAFGLLVAPSAAGAGLALAAVSGFFLRRPMKLLLSRKNDPRQLLALVCVTILTLLGLSGLLLAARLGSVGGLWPLVPAAVTGAIFAWCDGRNGAREGAAEVAGAVAFGILPAAFGALAGCSMAASLALAAMMLVRSVPTVLTVRTCLRLAKGKHFSATPSVVAVVTGIVLMAWLAAQHLAPWIATIFAVIFAVRTMWLLLWRPQITARKIGLTEAVLGGLMVLILSLTWKGAAGW